MTIDKEKIRAAAMAATQGEWSSYKTSVYLPNVYGGFDLYDTPNPNNNAIHIATSNPSTVLSLLDALDKAEKGAAELRAALEMAVSNCFTEYSYRQVMEDPGHFVNVAIKSVKGGK